MNVGARRLLGSLLVVQTLLIPLIVATPSAVSTAIWPTDEWETSDPEDVGMNSSILASMDAYIAMREYDLHGLVVTRYGKIVHESYPHPSYNTETPHRIYSVTKSVGSILVGIAIDKGYIPSLNERVIDFFPEYTIANLDGRKENMTIEHLLTMTCGVEWWEWDYPLEDPRNSYYNYTLSPNHIQYFLDLPMQYEPGEVWVYNSPSITILSHILLRATGMTPLEFAQVHLFNKLGIETVYWLKDPFGVECMSGALYLSPRDMAKIGHLMLMNGTSNDEQIVSEEWVYRATTTHIAQPYHPLFPDYGYLWWLSPELGCYSAQGRFGQRIFVLPQYDIVLSFTCQLNEYLIQPWDYFIEEFIIPAVLDESPTTNTTSSSTTETTGGSWPSFLSVATVGASFLLVIAATVFVWRKVR